jgi:hypothetical protein
MKTVHIYKLSTHKYFFTTFLDNTSSNEPKDYEYIGNIDVEDNVEQLSIYIYTQKIKDDETTTEIKCILDNFDDVKLHIESTIKSIANECPDVCHMSYTRNILSNVYVIDILSGEGNLQFDMINMETINTIDVKQFLSLQPKTNNIEILDLILDTFQPDELDVYIMSLPISTNPYQTMRRRGSCMTTIDEYYIPQLGVSYNFYDGEVNIWDNGFGKKHVGMVKTKISGEKLYGTLRALKSYTEFKLHVGKLFFSEPTENS